ncbi:MMPL family transporter [Fulvivirgaceae bacterium BMA10]|uniref:MMPL family transporter n=1 Tax=Splendidivirga corallicola TaxID=3051826 RepID=A0ABT8KHA2_9BACT|nr:MMPL family transporter [Fulvivirgaceae bacterium BMA10]
MYKKYARLTLGIILILTIGHIYFITELKFDYNFENFFPKGDEDLEFYNEFRNTFENDNDYLLLGFRSSSGIFDQTFLTKIDSLSAALEKNKRVEHLITPVNFTNPIISSMGLFQVPLLHIDDPKRYHKDSLAIYKDPVLPGTFFSNKGGSLAMVLKHTPMMQKQAADSLINEIESLIEEVGLENYHMAGKAKAQGVYIRKMQHELIIFLSISFVLVTAFLIISYRAVWSVVVPLIAVVLAIIWTLGFMGLFGKSLDIMLVLLPSILFVVAMSDVVHILTKYIEELRIGKTKIEALKVTFKEVGMATFLTSVTTAIGFLTLYTASIKPIQEFGLYTAFGVFIAFILAFSLLPSVLLFLKKPTIVDHIKHKTLWMIFLNSSLRKVIQFRKFILYSSIGIILLALYGIYRVEINTYLMEDIPKNDPLREDFLFFDREFGGSRPFEIAIEVIDTTKTVFDQEVLGEIEKVEDYLYSQYEGTNILSPVFVAKSLFRATNGGLASSFRLPKNNSEYQKLRRYLKYVKRLNRTSKLFSQDYRHARFSGKMRDIGSKTSLERNELLEAFIAKNTNENLVKFKLTGTSLLIDKNNNYLTQNMLEGLSIAFCVIAFIVAILFRSLRMVLITLIPNMIPLLVVAGLMGYFGINLKLSTSIIFTIAFGIAVDDTIHFISKLKIELGKGKTLLYALKRTYFSTGKAIIITTIILSGGFLTLILSSFGGTFYTGLLVSLTLLFAVIIDLTLLPVLLIMFFKRKSVKA